jgi:hypothetical protein
MENMDIAFELEDYLVENGWKRSNNIWRKGKKSLYFTDGGLMIALNNKADVKHRHIVTCEVPKDFFEANIIFKNCRLNFKTNKDDSENEY